MILLNEIPSSYLIYILIIPKQIKDKDSSAKPILNFFKLIS